VIIRRGLIDDAPAMAAIERASWPAELAATEEQCRARVTAFPEGQLIATLSGDLVGVIWTQRIPSARLIQPGLTFDLVTDCGQFLNTHDPEGDVFQLVGVGVAPQGRGLSLGRTLVDRAIELARSLPGVRRIVGFTRPARYHRHPEITIEEYVTLCNEQGRTFDPVLAFHLDAGARLVSIHPEFRPADHEARGYGVLIEYPVM